MVIRQISKATGLTIPFTSSISSISDGGMMGGTGETWIKAPKFSNLLAQCTLDKSYSHGVIDYKRFWVFTSQFEEKGMGKTPGCVKEVKSRFDSKFIAIDNGFIYIYMQWY